MSRVRAYTTATLPALVVLVFFVWFANWIPQTRWTPPVRQAVAAEMSPAQLARIGEKIVRERGCLTCHTLEPGVGVQGHGRGPNLIGIAARRAGGAPGGPSTLVDYLAQSLHEPGTYLVEGYANIMPASTRPPAKLDDGEVVAVINYLQSLGA
ncbi:MAG: cytochrome c, partial [Gammaproteobacteria bacterium]|nr:cytochrome c [Gammaproteobacteria bacterium]